MLEDGILMLPLYRDSPSFLPFQYIYMPKIFVTVAYLYTKFSEEPHFCRFSIYLYAKIFVTVAFLYTKCNKILHRTTPHPREKGPTFVRAQGPPQS